MRQIPQETRAYIIQLMKDGMSQYEIMEITKITRPTIRKIAQSVGFSPKINGKDILGQLCMCTNCGAFFRRALSRIVGSKSVFCDQYCKDAFMRGPSHPGWKHGKSATTFSEWLYSQSCYQEWRLKVLEKYNNRCAISNRDFDLDVHHLIGKAEENARALDVDNGIVLNKEIHQMLHAKMRQNKSFEESTAEIKKELGIV